MITSILHKFNISRHDESQALMQIPVAILAEAILG